MSSTVEARHKFEHWLQHPNLDEPLRDELKQIENNPKEIEERFYRNLEFGTGGLRGIIGAGTNRINIHTIRKATKGLADYLLKIGDRALDQGVVIAYDPRHGSRRFAEEAALVLVCNGIKAYLFEDIRPTPELSFAVRELGAMAGIVITASHNPPEYNGYKVYGEDGGQITSDAAGLILACIDQVGDELQVKTAAMDRALQVGLLVMLGEEMDAKYNEQLKQIVLNPNLVQQVGKDYTMVYTPLHGTGNQPIRRILQEIGFDKVHIVSEQELPDPDFSTVESPNPEESAAFQMGIRLAQQVGAHLIMATDPDADRIGFTARDRHGEYRQLTGNQIGALLVEYILSQRARLGNLPDNGVIIKTIVTSELGQAVAAHYGVETINTLTGFKYIGEKIKQYEQTGEKTFLFGYEESYGYLIGDFVRDKDAVQAAVIGAEMAAYYYSQGKMLFDALHHLYERHGYFQEDLVSLTFPGIEGVERIRDIMNMFRDHLPKEVAGFPISRIEDYNKSIEGLPRSNVLRYTLQDGSWFCIRPSGTEPKVKIYFSVQGESQEKVSAKLQLLRKNVLAMVER